MSALRRVTGSEAALELHRRINRTSVEYPRDSGVPALFAERARERPGAQAVVQGERALTYREMDRLSNGLALELAANGVTPGATVGVCVARSPELVVALLAVLKCGAAYLPFDAAWPDERLYGLFADGDCRWVVSDLPLAGRLGDRRLIPVAGAPQSTTGPDVEVSADAIAYINFTSGSTGRPKGVPIRHRGITRLVCGARYVRLGPDSRLLHLAPVTFDAATFELWGALLNGGTCVLYPDPHLRLSKLGRVLREQDVGVLFLTTALFNSVVGENPDALDGVGTVLTGGEVASMRHMAEGVRRYGPGRLVHVYGPTESTTFATFHPVDAIPAGAATLPIGLPIQNTRLYVVDGDRLCEAGRIGEIWLAGDGLAPGYLGRPELTADRFVDRLIGGEPERLYRTGDFGFLRPDGELVFQGRKDDQVKVNGFRIELGEIAHHLELHPAVRSSYVTVRAPGDRAVWAFAVTDDASLTSKSLRDHLRARLPAYMVPARIHLCEALPLTETGKVDRHALLAAYTGPRRRPEPHPDR
ncbi:amino acid adenylation domain-containing protein [Streptomyces sp.]|uniref:amino acid adenylation domain-containing protein n=1 Tax=Streptomyces sp. TaxID=1931 RepID=UPI002F405C2B